MPGTPLGISTDMAQNRCDSPAIRLYLHRWPRLVVLAAGILGFDADEMTVAGTDTIPYTGSSVIASTRGDHVERAITSET